MDCYKVIIRDICNVSSAWGSMDAKWFDECDQSNNTEIDVYTFDLKNEEIDHLWMGTVSPYGNICIDFLKFMNKGGNPNWDKWLEGA